MRAMEMKMGVDKILAMGMKKMCVGAVNTSVHTTCAFFMGQPKKPDMLNHLEKLKL